MGGTASKEQKGEQSSSENLTKSNFGKYWAFLI